MFDAAGAEGMQRVRGRAEVALGPGGLVRLYQSGAAKAMLPRTHGGEPEVVLLNSAGGLTGGDRLDYALRLDPGVRATATTQTAERAYDAGGGVAEVALRFEVGAGGALDWLPQETILFDGAALERRTMIALAGDARCIAVEMLVLGRAAMGETVRHLRLRDRREIRRDGRPVWVEPLALDDAALARGGGAATLRGARALASVVIVAQGAEDALGPVRALLDTDAVEAAASAWDGRLVLRALAADMFPLRRLMARVLTQLRQRPLPRVWQP